MLIHALQENAVHVKPMMTVLAITSIYYVLQIFKLKPSNIASGVINAILAVYFFIVIYSLRQKFLGNHGSAKA